MSWHIPKLKSYKFSKDVLGNHDWYEKSWSGVLFPLYIVGYGCVYVLNKKFKDAFRVSITFVKEDKMSWLWDGRDIKRIRERLLDLATNRPKVIDGYMAEWKKKWALFKRIVAKLEKIDFVDLTDRELFTKYAELRDAYADVNSLPYLVDSFLTSGEDDWLSEMIKKELANKVGKDKVSNIIALLTAPTENSFSNNEEIDLLKTAIKFKRGEDIKNFISRHVKKYYWVQNGYYPTKPLDENYFLGKVKEISKQEDIWSKLEKEENRTKENKKVKEKLYRDLATSDKLKKIIKTTEKFTAWQDTRKSGVFIMNHFVFQILEEIGRRVRLEPFEIFYITDHELKDVLFKKKFDKKVLWRRREEGCIFVHTKNGAYLVEPGEAKKYPKGKFLDFKKGLREIKGTPACAGVVKGRVRVIENVSQFSNFKSGEILVTNNTTPDFVPLMKMAAAIITEQGGVTTHAAIVSRELKIPCVIGTKIATKVLRDGDLVEVDAEKGIIKLLNKSIKI